MQDRGLATAVHSPSFIGRPFPREHVAPGLPMDQVRLRLLSTPLGVRQGLGATQLDRLGQACRRREGMGQSVARHTQLTFGEDCKGL